MTLTALFTDVILLCVISDVVDSDGGVYRCDLVWVISSVVDSDGGIYRCDLVVRYFRRS